MRCAHLLRASFWLWQVRTSNLPYHKSWYKHDAVDTCADLCFPCALEVGRGNHDDNVATLGFWCRLPMYHLFPISHVPVGRGDFTRRRYYPPSPARSRGPDVGGAALLYCIVSYSALLYSILRPRRRWSRGPVHLQVLAQMLYMFWFQCRAFWANTSSQGPDVGGAVVPEDAAQVARVGEARPRSARAILLSFLILLSSCYYHYYY